MEFPSTFVEVLQGHAAHAPARRAYTFLQGEVETGVLTYGALDVRARAIAAMLQGERLEGRRVLLLYAPGLQFIEAFLGCLYAGAIAVPAYPPDPGMLKRSLPRFRAIIEDAQADAVLTVGPILALLRAATSQLPDLQPLKWLTSDQVDDGLASSWRWPAIEGDSLAFLQYTSGSTSAPKGVMVSHRNILNNERVIQEAFGHTSESVITGWLPFYHDMGLIGNILQPAYLGSSCYLMSPMEFLRRPLAWIRTISTYRAETSGGPNFAYDLCVRKLKAAGDLDLDLSSWRVAFNGSEPVRADTLRRFAHAFAPYGFDERAFYPCYGLAESTLFVTGGTRGDGAAIRAFDVDALQRGTAIARDQAAVAGPEGRALRAPGPVERGLQPPRSLAPVADRAQQRELVGCGATFGGHECLIVNPESSLPVLDGTVGEVWVAGPSVVSGYWRRPTDTDEIFGATLATGDGKAYLRTGDLGFVHGNELFVTGRRKDLIIVRGRNHYPQDIEETAQTAYAGLRPGCCAAFSVDGDGEERLVVAQEVGAELRRQHRGGGCRHPARDRREPRAADACGRPAQAWRAAEDIERQDPASRLPRQLRGRNARRRGADCPGERGCGRDLRRAARPRRSLDAVRERAAGAHPTFRARAGQPDTRGTGRITRRDAAARRARPRFAARHRAQARAR